MVLGHYSSVHEELGSLDENRCIAVVRGPTERVGPKSKNRQSLRAHAVTLAGFGKNFGQRLFQLSGLYVSDTRRLVRRPSIPHAYISVPALRSMHGTTIRIPVMTHGVAQDDAGVNACQLGIAKAKRTQIRDNDDSASLHAV